MRMRGQTRFLLFIVGSLVVVLGFIIFAQIFAEAVLDDTEPTAEVLPDRQPLESSECWYTPSAPQLVFWDADFDGELGATEVIDAGGPYMVLGQSAGYFYIQLDDGRQVWVDADAGTQTGAECGAMPFAPGGDEGGFVAPPPND